MEIEIEIEIEIEVDVEVETERPFCLPVRQVFNFFTEIKFAGARGVSSGGDELVIGEYEVEGEGAD